MAPGHWAGMVRVLAGVAVLGLAGLAGAQEPRRGREQSATAGCQLSDVHRAGNT